MFRTCGPFSPRVWSASAAATKRSLSTTASPQRILLASAPLVKPGGSLIYSVCTLTKAESIDIVDKTAEVLAGFGFVSDLPTGDPWVRYGPGTLVVVPGPDTDGMALARWRRA